MKFNCACCGQHYALDGLNQTAKAQCSDRNSKFMLEPAAEADCL
jgi:hypothetical protein